MQDILILDDESEYLSLLLHTFQRQGWQVHATIHAHEALHLLDEKVFDCILSDMQMPETNGFQFLTYLRISKKNNKTLALAMSGYFTQSLVESKLDFTLTGFLEKPFSYQDFLQEFNRVSKRKQEQASTLDLHNLGIIGET